MRAVLAPHDPTPTTHPQRLAHDAASEPEVGAPARRRRRRCPPVGGGDERRRAVDEQRLAVASTDSVVGAAARIAAMVGTPTTGVEAHVLPRLGHLDDDRAGARQLGARAMVASVPSIALDGDDGAILHDDGLGRCRGRRPRRPAL
jgi:hypothetical protein